MAPPPVPSGSLTAPPPAPSPAGWSPLLAALWSRGDRTAVVADGGPRLTYAGLADRVARRAAELGDGRRLVMIRGGSDVETLVTYLGALAGGHVAWLAPGGPGDGDLADAFRPDVVARCGAEGPGSTCAPRRRPTT